MKKSTIFSVVISLLPTLFFGCTQSPVEQDAIVVFDDINVFEVEYNPDAGNHNYDYMPWDAEFLSFRDKTAKKRVTVEFNGEKFTGEYSDSWISCPNSYVTHRYTGKGVWFAINAESGKITELTVLNRKTPTKEFSEDRCREFADKIAGKYIDLSEYAVEVDEDSNARECRYRYTRKVDGLATAEYLSINVNSDGSVISFYTRMLRQFDNVAGIEYDEAKVNDAINAKLETIYKNVDKYTSYTVKNIYLTKLENGSYGLVCSVVCEFEKEYINNNGAYTIPTTPITFLIIGATIRPAN